MRKMAVSNVLIVGMKGLGVEIGASGKTGGKPCWRTSHRGFCPFQRPTAKNVVLAGVKLVTIFDSQPAEIADLSSQYFIHPEDVGKRRDAVTLPRLAELNSYVPVSVLEGEFELQKLNHFQVRF
jgi:ubiquitin-activating enzyme E1